jgi:hypothetical protein
MRFPQGLKCAHDNFSFAPLGLDHFALVPTAYAVGFILWPLRGYKPLALFHPESAIRVLTHTLKPASRLVFYGAAESRFLSKQFVRHVLSILVGKPARWFS